MPAHRLFKRSVRPLLVLACSSLGLMAGPAAASCRDQGLILDHPQIRATAPNAPVSAGYLHITNQTGRTQTLISASASFAARSELHDMTHEDGVMKMAEIEGGLVLEDGQSATLKPMGRHLMFMNLNQQLKDGERFDVTLTFAPCGAVILPFDVVKIPARMKDHSHSPSHKHQMKAAD